MSRIGRVRARVPVAALAALLFGASGLAARQQAEPARDTATAGAAAAGPETRDPFEPLDLPAPSGLRDAAGSPGPDYWQQRADYEIRAELDPATHTIAGSETITYTNNSPDTLGHVWLQLDQNLFRPGSAGSVLTPPGTRFRGAFAGGGFEIRAVAVSREGGRREARRVETAGRPGSGPSVPAAEGAGDAAAGPAYLVDGTKMRLTLADPVPPRGGQVRIHLEFAFRVPRQGADRTGRLEVERGTVYQIAQWYPRVFVYDDVNGWNALPYLGQGEWYLEVGSFDVALTVPRDFLVAATGRLENPAEVLTAEQRSRLERAAASQEAVAVVTAEEVGLPGTRPDGAATLTWRFRADSVRDFAWAASDAFLWDAAGWNGVVVSSLYPHEGLGTDRRPGWERATAFGLHAVRFYSERYGRYPYPHAVNVAGPVRGMEYPGIVFCSVEARGAALFAVTDHEFGHTWFPMMVGSDERRHAWMDEGLTTFMNYYSAVEFLGDGRLLGLSMDDVARLMASPGADQPVHTQADRVRREALGFLAYRKPAAALIVLREYVLGPERFDPAFREYIERWRWLHPQPADFFRTIEGVAGADLDWFWGGWFFGSGTLDQAIAGVAVAGDTVEVTVENRGELVMPAVVEVTFEDGSTERLRVPVQAWYTEEAFTARLIREGGGAVRNVQLDPARLLPDTDRTNNVWGRGVTLR